MVVHLAIVVVTDSQSTSASSHIECKVDTPRVSKNDSYELKKGNGWFHSCDLGIGGNEKKSGMARE